MGRQTICIHEIEGLTCERNGLNYKVWKPIESLETFFYGMHISMYVVVDIIVSDLMFWKCKLTCMHWCPHSLPLRVTSKLNSSFIGFIMNVCGLIYIQQRFILTKNGLCVMVKGFGSTPIALCAIAYTLFMYYLC